MRAEGCLWSEEGGKPYSLGHEAMRPEGEGKSPCWSPSQNTLCVPLGRPGTGSGCQQGAKSILAPLTCASGLRRRTELALESCRVATINCGKFTLSSRALIAGYLYYRSPGLIRSRKLIARKSRLQRSGLGRICAFGKGVGYSDGALLPGFVLSPLVHWSTICRASQSARRLAYLNLLQPAADAHITRCSAPVAREPNWSTHSREHGAMSRNNAGN